MGVRKKKILVLTTTFPRWKNDATPPFCFHLAQRLQKHFQVYVLAPHSSGAKTKERIGGIKVYRFRYLPNFLEKLCYEGGGFSKIRKNFWLSLQLPFYFLAGFLATYQLVRKEKINIINAHWIIPQGFIAVLIKKITTVPVIITSHGTDVFGFNQLFFIIVKKITLANSDLVFAVSRKLKEKIKKIAPDQKSKVQILSMGVEIDYFRKLSAKNKQAVKRRLGSNRKIVIFVGRLSAEKGIDCLIKAIAIVKKTIPSVLLLIIGEGPLKNDLVKQVDNAYLQGEVKFLGWLNHRKLPGYYGAADVFVSPTVATDWGSEGLGLTFIEALASGTTVIGTKAGGIVEIIKDGENGILVPQRSPAKLAEAIIKVLKSPELKVRFQANTSRMIKENYDWSVVESKYKTAIENVI